METHLEEIARLREQIQQLQDALKEAIDERFAIHRERMEEINQLQQENAQLKEKVAEAWDACHACLLWEFGRSETPAPNKAEYLKSITDKTE